MVVLNRKLAVVLTWNHWTIEDDLILLIVHSLLVKTHLNHSYELTRGAKIRNRMTRWSFAKKTRKFGKQITCAFYWSYPEYEKYWKKTFIYAWCWAGFHGITMPMEMVHILEKRPKCACIGIHVVECMIYE